MAYHFVLGDPKASCDVCGFVYNLSALRKQWDGLMVCPADFNHRHPQQNIKGIPDHQGIRPNMRPEPADTFIEPTATTANDL